MSRGDRKEITMNNKDEFGSYELPELVVDDNKAKPSTKHYFQEEPIETKISCKIKRMPCKTLKMMPAKKRMRLEASKLGEVRLQAEKDLRE